MWLPVQEIVPDTHDKATMQAPITTIPVLIRGGSIIPIKQWRRRSTFLQFRDPFTLLVALDAQGEANGELYDDDQQTTAFAEGNYINPKFSFTNNILSSNVRDPKMKREDFFDDYDVYIERIKVIGLSAQPTSVTLEDGTAIETEWLQDIKVIILHRLKLEVKKSWSISFNYGSNANENGSKPNRHNSQTGNEANQNSNQRIDL